MSITRTAMVAWAISKLGVKEGSTEHRKLLDLYNSQKPLPRGVKADEKTAWCGIFTSCAALANNAQDIVPTEMSVGQMIEKAKKMGCWQERDDYEPKPGDFITYDWQDSGAGDNSGWPDHIGMVERVTAKTIYTIEGNVSDQVARRNIKVNGKNIRGFITPHYEATGEPVTAPQDKPTNEPQKNLEAVVRDVRAGKYGNEPERSKKLTAAGYNAKEVQAAVNAQIAAEKKEKEPTASVYIVATQKDNLNIRAGRGIDTAILGTIPKGNKVAVSDIKDGWAKLANRSGYVSANFLKKS